MASIVQVVRYPALVAVELTVYDQDGNVVDLTTVSPVELRVQEPDYVETTLTHVLPGGGTDGRIRGNFNVVQGGIHKAAVLATSGGGTVPTTELVFKADRSLWT